MRDIRLLTSIDLRWLSRHARGIPVPKLVVDDELDDYSGYYSRPVDGEVIINEFAVDGRSGVIVVSGGSQTFAVSTIAHEWRHHWQIFNGRDWKGSVQLPDFEISYEDGIAAFFKQPHELDALLFERRVAPDETNESWLDIIHDQDAKCRRAVVDAMR